MKYKGLGINEDIIGAYEELKSRLSEENYCKLEEIILNAKWTKDLNDKEKFFIIFGSLFSKI